MMLPILVASCFLTGAAALPALVCQTQSSPNPVVDEYPGDVTGKFREHAH